MVLVFPCVCPTIFLIHSPNVHVPDLVLGSRTGKVKVSVLKKHMVQLRESVNKQVNK